MTRFFRNLWAGIRAQRLIASVRNQLEKRLSPDLLECVVSDKLKLTGSRIESLVHWDGEAYFPFWQKDLHVYLCHEKGKPSQEQLDLLRKLLGHHASIRDEVLTQFARFYNSRIYPNREQFRRVLELPAVQSTDDIYTLVGDPKVSISFDAGSEPVRFELAFHPEWKEGGHIDMRIIDWAVDDPLFNDLPPSRE